MTEKGRIRRPRRHLLAAGAVAASLTREVLAKAAGGDRHKTGYRLVRAVRFGRRRRGTTAVAVAVPLFALSLGLPAAGQAAVHASVRATTPSVVHYSRTFLGKAPAGKRVTPKVYRQLPILTKSQVKLLLSRMSDGKEPSKGRMGKPPHHAPLSPAMRSPLQRGSKAMAPAGATMLRDTLIPVSAVSGGASSLSYTQEPSTDADYKGQDIFQTGNWYATFSNDGGATWSFLDPLTLFGSGYCCDQVTQFDPGTGHQFWLLQFDDHLVLANAPSVALGGAWCYLDITPKWLGLPAGTGLDYNDMTITNNFVNISTNFFPNSGGDGSGLLRLPVAPMTKCAAFKYRYVTRTDNFTFKLVPDSTTTLYWGSNWGQTNGSSFRIFAWPENSTSYQYWTRNVPSYRFYIQDDGQKCGSTDGVVKNWCQYADSRVLGAYLAHGVLGFSFNAKQDSSHPFPYTRIVRFSQATKAFIGASDYWGSWGAVQFMSLATNAQTQVGGEFVWGGGTGNTHFYPGAAVNTSGATSISLNPNYYLWGAGNTCTFKGLYRWGDYLTVRTYWADPNFWIGAGYAMVNGDCGSAKAFPQPRNIVFSS